MPYNLPMPNNTKVTSFDLPVLDGYWVLAYKKNSIGALHTVCVI